MDGGNSSFDERVCRQGTDRETFSRQTINAYLVQTAIVRHGAAFTPHSQAFTPRSPHVHLGEQNIHGKGRQDIWRCDAVRLCALMSYDYRLSCRTFIAPHDVRHGNLIKTAFLRGIKSGSMRGHPSLPCHHSRFQSTRLLSSEMRLTSPLLPSI